MDGFEPALEVVRTGRAGHREAEEWLMDEAKVEGVPLTESRRPEGGQVGRWGQGHYHLGGVHFEICVSIEV